MYRIPIFEGSLKLASTDYDSPSPDRITRLLEYVVCLALSAFPALTGRHRNMRASGSPSAILITRYLNVVTCLRLRAPTQDVFVLFNPRINPEHEQVASLTFSTSLPQIARCLCDVFPLDNVHLAQVDLDRQAKLLEKCTVHVFVPRATSYDARIGEEALIVSSLTLLTLRAELEELSGDNVSLKKEKQQLEKSIVDLQTRLQEEKTKGKRVQSSKQSVMKSARGPSLAQARSPRTAQPWEREYFFDVDDQMDPNLQFALQLQATFDSENELLLKQKGELVQTAQRQYDCGVCLDDFPEDDAVYIEACGHEICRDCARGHVCSKIGEHRFPVLCPVCMADHKNQNPGSESRHCLFLASDWCLPRSAFSGAMVQLLGVSEEQWATWVEMEIAQFSIPFNCRKCVPHPVYFFHESLC